MENIKFFFFLQFEFSQFEFISTFFFFTLNWKSQEYESMYHVISKYHNKLLDSKEDE